MSDPAGKVFFPQQALDRILDQGRGRLEGDRLILTDERYPAYLLQPAHRVRRVSGGGDDPYRLAGKILSEEQVREVGGSLYMGSLVVGETAYEIESGFLGAPASAPTGPADERWADDILRMLD
ncbi:MAG: hypothetical protein A2V83_05735 [Nitrospirae bacterium RBG_16_64_22]|nr:MAG: hypothetical protein A2V83_05735 [Nitrospirae bacterium RBG_16_64_22]